MQSDLNEQIQTRAYALWETDGRPEGRADEYWHRAVLELVEAAAKKPAKRTRAASSRKSAAKSASKAA